MFVFVTDRIRLLFQVSENITELILKERDFMLNNKIHFVTKKHNSRSKRLEYKTEI